VDRLTSTTLVAGDTLVLSTDATPTVDILTPTRTTVEIAASWNPFTTNARTLGSTLKRWSTVNSFLGNFSGIITGTAGATLAATSGNLTVGRAAGGNILFNTANQSDVGASATPGKKLWFTDGNFNGTLDVEGATDINGALNVQGAAVFQSTGQFAGLLAASDGFTATRDFAAPTAAGGFVFGGNGTLVDGFSMVTGGLNAGYFSFGGTLTSDWGANEPANLTGFRLVIHPDVPPGVTPVPDVYGIYIEELEVTGEPSLRSTGLAMDTAFASVLNWGIRTANDIQASSATKVIFGGTSTTKGTEWLQKNAGAAQIDAYINSAAELSLDATALFPTTSSGLSSGTASLRWSGVNSVLGDFSGLITGTAGATLAGTSGNLTVGRALGGDILFNTTNQSSVGASATRGKKGWFLDFDINGTAVLAVVTASTSITCGTGTITGDTVVASSQLTAQDVNINGNTVVGTATTDTVRFNAGGNAAAPSTTIGVAIVNFYGSSATNFLGTPNRWWSIIADDGNTYKIPLYS
jgi:hypothetical protein